jgi:hypothetical protein
MQKCCEYSMNCILVVCKLTRWKMWPLTGESDAEVLKLLPIIVLWSFVVHSDLPHA